MSAEARVVTLAEIRAAADRIRSHILPTPTVSGERVAGTGAWLKAENLQRTGSFKPRGAMNAVLQLKPDQRRRGVITLSAGNHGQALAYAAQTIGVPCVEVVRVPVAEWQQRLEGEQQGRNLYLVHPFDDPMVVAGQGTVGHEVIESVPNLKTVLVPVGGGGLIAGVALALKQQRPDLRVIGVEPERAPAVSESLTAGHPVAPSRLDSVADGLAAPYTRPFNLQIIREHVDEIRTVSEEAIIDALRSVALKAKLVVEPAGAAAVAALLGDDRIERPVVAILTGGNVDAERLA